MSEKMSRQQKRSLMREEAKKQFKSGKEITPEKSFVGMERFDLLIQDVQRILNYTKTIDNHAYMLMETLNRLGVVKWGDLKETEKLFREREERKKDKVSDLLSRDLDVDEYLEEIKEEEDLPNYEKLKINPIKDLNLNPYEVGFALKEQHPNLTKEQYLVLGRVWDLREDHFGFKKEEPVAAEPVTEESAPEESAPEESAPEESAPEEPVTEESAPEEPVTEESAPEELVAEESAPEEPVTEESAPE